jgi:hypothetical protein
MSALVLEIWKDLDLHLYALRENAKFSTFCLATLLVEKKGPLQLHRIGLDVRPPSVFHPLGRDYVVSSFGLSSVCCCSGQMGTEYASAFPQSVKLGTGCCTRVQMGWGSIRYKIGVATAADVR